MNFKSASVVAVVVLGVLGGCGGSDTKEPNTDKVFLKEVKSRGITTPLSNADLLDLGVTACETLEAAGGNKKAILRNLMSEYDLGTDYDLLLDTSKVIGAADSSGYCDTL